MNATFTYNQEQASQIGGGQYVTKSGGYDFKVTRAQFTSSTNNQAKALEFDFETRDGLKCNYVSINYTKGDGQPNDFGHKMIQAIMGCAQVNQLSDNQGNCPELFNKYIKGVVQRVDYTKQSGAKAGQDGYKFDFKLPAHIQTGKTVKETANNEEAKSFKQYAESITDKDDRKPLNQSAGQSHTPQHTQTNSYAAARQGTAAAQQPNNTQDWDDDIPF